MRTVNIININFNMKTDPLDVEDLQTSLRRSAVQIVHRSSKNDLEIEPALHILQISDHTRG